MTLYRRKVETVDAFKWMPEQITMSDGYPVPEWLDGKYIIDNKWMQIFSFGEVLWAMPGDWIVKGKNGRIQVFSPAHFEAIFEAIKG